MILSKKTLLGKSAGEWGVGVVIAGLFVCALAYLTNIVGASGETITAGLTANTEIKTATTISGIQINGSDDSTVPVKLLVSNGSLSMTTTTGLTFTGGTSGSTLYFSGTRSNVNAALATLKYTRNTVGTDTLEISLVSSGEVFFSENGHLYEYVSSTLTWGGAKTAAEARTKYGASGYLATITSQAENDFVSARLANAGWMGASDVSSEGVWRWVTGPESGTQFCNGNNPCNSVSSRYTNWNTGEPNDSSGNEDCGQFLSGGSGKWNDLPCSGTTLPGYVVEYGATGNMPTVAAANISITTSDTVAPTLPVLSIISTPTTDSTPSVSWSSSSDLGTGLATPAYTLEWSTSATFATVGGSATTNSLTLSPPSNLADGTWYFRVKVKDIANNEAISEISGPVIIDTTAPSVPSLPLTATLWTNDNTPTFDWDNSIDEGVGLAYIAYGVQWSQDTSFFGLGGTAGTLSNTYTIPDGLHMVDATWYFRVKAIDALGHESAWSDYATIHIDTSVPVIDDVAVGNGPTSQQKIVTWTTDKNTSSKVSYGPTLALATDTDEIDMGTRVQDHSMTIVDLVPCSLYHFIVSSTDRSGNTVTSEDQEFITEGCAGSAEIISIAGATLEPLSGGEVALDSLSLEVPVGFASVSANFQIKQIDRIPALSSIGMPRGLVLANAKIYDIKALHDGVTNLSLFDRPIIVTLQYSDEEISQLVESTFLIYRWDSESGWTKLDNCNVDKVFKTVSCETNHFSTFALYGAAKSTKPITVSYTDHNTISTDQTPGDQNTPGDTQPQTTQPVIEKDNGNNQSANLDTTESVNYWGFTAAILLALGGIFWFILAKRRRKKSQDDSGR